jgi:vacuolar-type H+-ATPase subunit H
VVDDQQPVHDRVGGIIEAAEAAAERLRLQTEESVRDRIAEGQRAAENRVQAAEEESADIVRWAHEEAARLRDSGRSEAAQAKAEATGEALTVVARAQDQAEIIRAEAAAAKTQATSEALAIVARAQDSADETLAEANGAATKAKTEAETRSRELLREARITAGDVRTEGLELVENLRQMGDSLRSNAERLLRDVQMIHSRMVAQIDRADGGAGATGVPGSSRRAPDRGRSVMPGPLADGEVIEVPEFIPPG